MGVRSGVCRNSVIEGDCVAVRRGGEHPEVKDRQFAVDLAFDGKAPPAVRRGETVELKIEIGSPKDSLIVANIRQRPLRTAISITGVALGVILVVLFVGLAPLAPHARGARTWGRNTTPWHRPWTRSLFPTCC